MYQLLNGTVVRKEDGSSIPADSGNRDYAEYLAWCAQGNEAELFTPDLAAPVDPVAALTAALQSNMDAEARKRGYDDLKTAITYRGDPNLRFAAEAEGFFAWRSAVWTAAYAVLHEVKTGTRELPTPTEALALVPALSIAYATAA